MSTLAPPPTASPPDTSIRFQLRATTLGVEAEISLRPAGDRWICVSEVHGHETTGIGPTARGAVVASLSWLGPVAVSELLVDSSLLDVSWRLTQLAVP